MRRTFMLALVVLGGCDGAETVDAGPRDIDAARPDVGIDAGTTERDAGARTELDADTESGLDAMAEGGSAGEVDADSDGGLDASHDVGWYPFGISDAELVFDDPSLTCTPIDYTFRSPRPTVPAGTVLWTTELPPFLPIDTDRLTTRLIDPSGQVILHPSGSVSVQTLYPRGIATFDREGHFRSEREYSRNEPSWRFRSIGDDRILDPETAPEGPPGIPSRSPSRAGAILPNGTAWSMAEGETLAPGFHQLYLHIWCAREHQTKRVWRMEVGRAAPDIRATETEVMVGGSTLTHRFTHDGEYLGRREHEGLSETFSYNARCGWTTRDEPRWLEMDLSTVRYPIVMSSRLADRNWIWTSDCGAYLTDFERISPFEVRIRGVRRDAQGAELWRIDEARLAAWGMTGQLWGSYGVPDYGLSLSHGRVLFLREVEDDIELFIVDRQGSISWRRRYSSSEFRVTTGSGEPARLGILGSPWILAPNGVLFSTVTFDRRMWAYPSGVSAIYLGDDVEPDFLTRPDMGWAATNSVLPDELDRVAREPAPPRQ